MAWLKADLEILKQQAIDYKLYKVVSLIEYVEQLVSLIRARDLVIKDMEYELECLKMARMEQPDGPSTPSVYTTPPTTGGSTRDNTTVGGNSFPPTLNARS